jgi:hypothetical protein
MPMNFAAGLCTATFSAVFGGIMRCVCAIAVFASLSACSGGHSGTVPGSGAGMHSAGTTLPIGSDHKLRSFSVNSNGDLAFTEDNNKTMYYLAAGSKVAVQLRMDGPVEPWPYHSDPVAPCGVAVTDSGQIYSTDYGDWLVTWPNVSSVSQRVHTQDWGQHQTVCAVMAVDPQQDVYIGRKDGSLLFVRPTGEQQESMPEGMGDFVAVATPANPAHLDVYILVAVQPGTSYTVLKWPDQASAAQVLVQGLPDSRGLTVTPDGTVYVVEGPGFGTDNGSVVRIKPGDSSTTKIATPDLPHPNGIAADAHGNLYVGINHLGNKLSVGDHDRDVNGLTADQIVKFPAGE